MYNPNAYGIYLFRDYWSNRCGYGKTKAENESLDKISRKTLPPPPDLILLEIDDQLCKVVDKKHDVIYENLKNPYKIAYDLKIIKTEEEIGLLMIRACKKLLIEISALCSMSAVIVYFIRSPIWFISTIFLVSMGTLFGLFAIYAFYAKSLLRFWFMFFFTLGIFLSFISLFSNLLESILAFTQLMLGNHFVFAMGIFITIYTALFFTQVIFESPFNLDLSPFLPLGISFLVANLAYIISFFGIIPADIGFCLIPFRIMPLLIILISILYVPSFRPYQSWFTLYLYDGCVESKNFPFKNELDQPYWLLAPHKIYWVIRHILFWRFEFAFPLPHPDFERIELWVDAFSGELEWIVTDYHYRELWIRPDKGLKEIIVSWDGNFHTPIVYPHKLVLNFWRKIRYMSNLEKILSFCNQFNSLASSVRKAYEEAREIEALYPFFEDVGTAGARACNTIPWKYWRYPFGAYPKTKRSYDRWKRYANVEIGGYGEVASQPQVKFNKSVLEQYYLTNENPKVKF